MAIVLTFQSRAGSRRASKGPYRSVLIDGEDIREREGGPAIASHEETGWRVDGEVYLRVDVDTPVIVLWEGAPANGTEGTTGHFSSVNGIAYIDRRILAFLDQERQDWYVKREGRHKPVLVLRPAVPPDRDEDLP